MTGRSVRLIRAIEQQNYSANTRRIVAAAYSFILLLTVAATLWRVAGVPVRAILLIGFLGALIASHQDLARRLISTHRNLLILIASFGTLGASVSLINAAPLGGIIKEVLEIHVQSAVTLLATAFVIEICGAALAVRAFIAVIALSGFFAIGQFVGIDFFWTVRETISHLINEPSDLFTRERAVGLSMSTINLATHLCLGLAALGVYLQRIAETSGSPRKIDPRVIIGCGAFVFACLASGNRSPILGGLVFLALYMLRAPRLLVLTAPITLLAIPVVPIVFDMLQGSGLRAFQTGDKSSEGRAGLAYYGWMLFRDHPLGYGLTFDPTDYWTHYWQWIMTMPTASNIRIYPLHNYVLSMMNIYGVLILILIPFVVALIWRNRSAALPFIPYAIHIAFHNSGPFYNDTLIFCVFAIGTATVYRNVIEQAARVENRPAWRGPVRRS